MKCIQCNKENRKSVQFCEECGARLAKKAVTEQDVAARRQIKKVTIGTIGGILVIGALLFSLSQREYEEASAQQSVEALYQQFRLDYRNALNSRTFDSIDHYFKEGTAIKDSYRQFVTHVPQQDYYTFLTNTTDVEYITDDVAIVTANEIFELESDGVSALKERTRNYTFEREADTYVITHIENVEVAGEASSGQSEKAAYLASVQYALDMHEAAYEGGELKSKLWESYDVLDYELNRIYGLLKEKLSASDMEALRVKQRAWIVERDEMTANPSEIGHLTQIELLNDLTRERTLELIDIYFAY